MFKNTNIKLAQYLVTYIESGNIYKNLFIHHKQQYTVQKYLKLYCINLKQEYPAIIKNNVLTNFYDYYTN